VGIVEFIRERVADILRACRGRVALSDNINVSDISREFLPCRICIPWYPPSPELSSLTNHHWMSAIVIDPQKLGQSQPGGGGPSVLRGVHRDRIVVVERVEELPVLVGKHRIVHDVGGWRVQMLEIRHS
jgi:hypothetical protein